MSKEKTNLNDILNAFEQLAKKGEAKPMPKKEEPKVEFKADKKDPEKVKVEFFKPKPVEPTKESLELQKQGLEAYKKATAKNEQPQPEQKEKPSIFGIFGKKVEAVSSQPQSAPSPKQEIVTAPTQPTITEPIEVKKPSSSSEFDTSEEVIDGKPVIMIYGAKGKGKTALAMSMKGNIAVLSFDRQSSIVKKEMYKNDKRIRVWNAVRYLSKNSEMDLLDSSVKTFDYINHLLETIIAPWKPDWIICDGYHIYQQIAEMKMRATSGLLPFAGVANKNIWKKRRMYIWQLHKNLLDATTKGVIYTTYTEEKRIIKEGELIALVDVPKWVDIIMEGTNTVIKVDTGLSKDGANQMFHAIVESSKLQAIPTSGRIDITGGGFDKLIKGDL